MRAIKTHSTLKPAAVAFALLALVSGSHAVANTEAEDNWQFDLSVYAWLPNIEGKLNYGIPGSGDSIEMELGTILDDLQMTGMLGFGAHKDRWSALADVIYLDLADSENSFVPLSIGTGLELDVGAGLELKSWVAQVAGSYEVVRTDRASLGVKEAAAIGNATARSIDWYPREKEARIYPDSDSAWVMAYAGKDVFFEVGDARNLDARTMFHYAYTGVTPAMAVTKAGIGSDYGIAFLDSKKQAMDGSKTWRPGEIELME